MTGGATFVNGQPLQGPTLLNVGDVITLGSDSNPATIEIDPAGVAQGRSGYASESHAPSPTARPTSGGMPTGVYPSAYPGVASGVSTGRGMQAPPPPPPMQASDDSQDPGAADEQAFWGQAPEAATAGATSPRRKKPVRTSSDAGLVVGIALCLAIVGVTAWFIYQQMQKRNEPPPKVAAVVEPESHGPSNIFTGTGNDTFPPGPTAKPSDSAAKHSTPPTPARRNEREHVAAPPPVPADANPTPNAAPSDGAASASTPEADKTDGTLEEIENAHYLSDYGRAIVKFDDYRRQHQGQNTDKLDAYTNEALDRLWCKRIAELCTQRVALQKQIRQKDTEIRQETSALFKKTLAEEKAKLQTDLNRAEESLTGDMGYTSDEIPDPTNAETFLKLTTDRDPMKFANWKTRTVMFIRTHHGSLPWDG